MENREKVKTAVTENSAVHRKSSIGCDMTHGNITKLLLNFLWPFLLANLLNSIYNTVDMIIIGQFVGSASTVAVSQGGKLMNLLNHVATGLAAAAAYSIGDKIINISNVVANSIKQAGGSMAGQNIGAGYQDRAANVVYSALRITMAVALVLGAVLVLWPRAFFRLFTAEQEVLAYAPSFMAITFLTLFLSAYMSSFDIITTATGFSMLAFLAGFLDGVVFRIAFSFLLGMKLGMGVTGFFLANTLSRLGPCIIHSAYFFSGAWKKRRTLV